MAAMKFYRGVVAAVLGIALSAVSVSALVSKPTDPCIPTRVAASIEHDRPNKYAEKWERNFEMLVDFHKKFGHFRIPQHPTKQIPDEDYRSLHWFVDKLRLQYRSLETDEKPYSTSLTRERIKRLEAIGFIWEVREDSWMHKYKILAKFYEEHGHCNIMVSKNELGIEPWISYQRRRYWKGRSKRHQVENGVKPLPHEKIQLLEAIDFRWSSHDEAWWRHFNELKQVKENYGSFRVKNNNELRFWKNKIRFLCREYVLSVAIEGTTDGVHVSGLTPSRLQALRDIQFCWLPTTEESLNEQPEDIFEGYGH